VSRSVRAALSALAGRDPVLDGLIETHRRPPARRPVPVAERFASLARAIVYQQLAGRAAEAIHGRLVVALGGKVTPVAVLAATPELLKSAGLSNAKAAALRDLADKVASGEVDIATIGRLSDEEVVEHLVRVRGIGTWTAQMFLLASLGRMDVWPVGDYGVRAGFAKAWRLHELPSPVELDPLGEPFRPYRSIVAWYCWRVVEARLP
jgi:3-methyladenine DNA glycosylase/8-oxoguanine DNA glycosylase